MSLNAVSLATPFAAYLAGEELHVSGVLAVVVAGLLIGHDGSRLVSGASRLQVNAVWRLVDFLLEGLVFLLIGQQLPTVVAGAGQVRHLDRGGGCRGQRRRGAVLRPLWLLLTQSLPRLAARPARLARRRRRGRPRLGPAVRPRGGRAVSWAGTRGVISLAAIFTLPLLTDSGDRSPSATCCCSAPSSSSW